MYYLSFCLGNIYYCQLNIVCTIILNYYLYDNNYHIANNYLDMLYENYFEIIENKDCKTNFNIDYGVTGFAFCFDGIYIYPFDHFIYENKDIYLKISVPFFGEKGVIGNKTVFFGTDIKYIHTGFYNKELPGNYCLCGVIGTNDVSCHVHYNYLTIKINISTVHLDLKCKIIYIGNKSHFHILDFCTF
ncbi:hypothetical protein Catovirus_1_1012 [Catovirus CTV1]|uniref:Uncharacterized protein n=1 Tax=Catovirus CTV1 TaxID=1977631 RepID=A0A1V0SB81_9VIRU|nr:hypothetical protein Catovirus_1_1012 [Catovirus CTV1]